MQAKRYDCAIIGGGLAGLCLSVQLAERGIEVILFEKNQYPFHKVCGEYISMESWDFLVRLGLPLPDLHLPLINELGISSEKGFMLEHPLQLGGFGISRYNLDCYLSTLATEKGVTIMQNCRVNAVQSEAADDYTISTSVGDFGVKMVCGSYGKYTPSFIQEQKQAASRKPAQTNYIGVKYHIHTRLQPHRIELHNFQDGYCGVSKIDHDWYCLCYLTTAANLQKNGKDIKQMEENVLYKNPHLRKYFLYSDFLYAQPLVISNIQFRKKETDSNGILMLGDAAGSITPLCGNGMSMAMRASALLATELIRYFDKKQSRKEVEGNYKRSWNKSFHTRIMAGFYLQNLFGKRDTTDLALKMLSKMPHVMNRLVRLTHGSRF